MANAYTELGIASDPQDAKAEMEDELAARIPGWTPIAGSLTDQLMETVALQVARIGAALEEVALETFVAYGTEIVQEPFQAEEHAAGVVTFTSSHTDGVFIPIGTVILGSDGSGGDVVFHTTQDATIESGDTTVTGVPVEAVDPGLLPNPVSGAAELSSGIEGISSVEFDTDSSVGADGETTQEYADRLAEHLRLLSASPVTPDDYDVFLRTNFQAVHRVLVRDGYDPTDNSEGNAGMLTVSMIDSSGAHVGAGVDADAAALIAENRHVDDITHIVAPTVTEIDVTYTVILEDGYVEADVIATCDAALVAYLSPSMWGQPRTSDEPGWVLKTALRPVGMLGPVIGNCEGVESVESVLACAAGGTPATTTITLSGDAPLTDVGTLIGSEA